MNKNERKLSSQGGSVTVLVVITIFSFAIILMGTYLTITTLLKSQIKSDIRIQELYGADVNRIDDLYEEITTVPMETITTQFNKAYGVIEIVWLDTDNNVISDALSPASYLGGLTPVKWTGTAGSYIETTTTTSDTDWYSYTAQTGATTSGGTSKWANAVTSDGNAYFVWIPRYAYKITYFDNETNKEAYRADNTSTTGIVGYSTIYGMLDITGEKQKLVEGTKPTNVTGTVKTSAYSDYIPHPAFEFDGAKPGIWVGKYQSSGSTTTVTIKPDEIVLTTVGVKSNIFTANQGVKTTYGLTSDSHMMKNTEWGAVAYLTESKYGRNGTKVSTNNNSGFYTGRSAGSSNTSSFSYVYNTENGILASTTGNIFGIYDMSGPIYQYVAGYIDNEYAGTTLINADTKYKDVYSIGSSDTSANNYSANKGIKGDAVYETSTDGTTCTSWHKNHSYFPNISGTVFLRGRLLQ